MTQENNARIRIRFWPALTTLAALAVVLSLGVWQIERLAWKEGLIAQAKSAQSKPVADLNAPETPPAASLYYRNVTVRGTFLHDKELHMIGRSPQGKSGYHLVTPLEIEGTENTILVNRGWVPFTNKEQETRPGSLTEGIVSIVGIMMKPKEKRRFTPANSPQDNLWLWYDFAAISEMLAIDLPAAVIHANEITPSNDNKLPQLTPTTISFRNDHLGYAVTWFMIAFGIVVIFITYHRKKP